MSKRSSFSCICFCSAGTSLALPIGVVGHVMDPDPAISHISGVLGQERWDVDTRVLELRGDARLKLAVDVPVNVVQFHVDEVIPASAKQVAPFHQGLIEHNGELILMLDPEPLLAALLREQHLQSKETE